MNDLSRYLPETATDSVQTCNSRIAFKFHLMVCSWHNAGMLLGTLKISIYLCKKLQIEMIGQFVSIVNDV